MNAGTKTETTPKVNVQQAVPFFGVKNIAESIRYYVEGLGFQMTKKWIDEGQLRWCWLQLGGAALMLQEFRKAGHDSYVPAGKVGEGVSICFQCVGCPGNLSRRHLAWNSNFRAIRRQQHVGRRSQGPGRLQNRIREPHGRAGRNKVFGVAVSPRSVARGAASQLRPSQ